MAQPDKYKRRRWLCQCSCGAETTVIGLLLRDGSTTSCGCYQRSLARINVSKFASPATVKHGMAGKHLLYGTWTRMIGRCTTPEGERAKYYFEKGIKVCPEWRHDFLRFYQWALENGWKAGLQLDRKKSDEDYSPSNCQWLTASQHSKKTRKESV